VSDLFWFLLLTASGGVLITLVTYRTHGIRAKGWLLFTTWVALTEGILCAVVWRDSMGVGEPLQSGIPFATGYICAFLVGLAVFLLRHRSSTFRAVAAISTTVVVTACSPYFVLFLGCTFGPCI
jgi:hypothetical protein